MQFAKKFTTTIGHKIVESGVFWLAFLVPVYAQGVPTKVDEGVKAAQPEGAGTDLFGIVTKIINTLLLLVGILSVIMLIVGGIRYVVSSGNQDQVQGAKNTIVYALLGLVIAILAYAIINFITGQLSD